MKKLFFVIVLLLSFINIISGASYSTGINYDRSNYRVVPLPFIHTVPETFSGGVNIPQGKIIFVDSVNGSDSTGTRGTSLAFATPVAAKAASLAGDTIVVGPGTYDNSINLLKNGVNWHFMPGSIVNGLDVDGGAGIGIWDDRGNGACTSSITGDGVFYMRAAVNPSLNILLRGTVSITNARSRIFLKCNKIQGTFIDVNIPAIVNIKNGTNVIIADIVEDPFDKTTYYYEDESTITPSVTTGLYWEHGELFTEVKKMKVSGYGLYGSETTPVASSANEENWYHSGELIDNVPISGQVGGITAPAMYTVSGTKFWRLWINATEIKSSADGWRMFGTGKFYLTAQKISVADADAYPFVVSQTGTNESWITVQKISGKAGWVSMVSPQAGTVNISAQQYEDLGITAGFLVASGNLNILGGLASITNIAGTGIYYTGGKIRATGLMISTSGSTNAQIFCNSENMILSGCTLVGTNIQFSITSNVSTNNDTRLYNTVATSTVTNKIVNLVGSLTVDTDVK